MRTMTPGFRAVLSNYHFPAAPPPRERFIPGDRVTITPCVDADLAHHPGKVRCKVPSSPCCWIIDFDDGSAIEAHEGNIIRLTEAQ